MASEAVQRADSPSGMGHPFLQRHQKQSGVLWSACLIGQLLGEFQFPMWYTAYLGTESEHPEIQCECGILLKKADKDRRNICTLQEIICALKCGEQLRFVLLLHLALKMI